MNKKMKIAIGILVAFVVLNVLKNGLIQVALSASLSKVAHVPVHIGSTRARILATAITLKNIRVRNPRGFPEKWMLDVPQVSLDFDLSALTKGQAHFEEIRLDLKELTVVKNRDGRLNVDVMKPSHREKQKSKEVKKETAQGKTPKLKIDRLYLTIGRVVYRDYSGGGSPHTEVFEIGIQNRLYANIQDPSAVVNLILFEALTRTTLSRLAGLDIGDFKEGAMGVLTEGLGFVKDGADTVEDATDGIFGLFR